MKSVEMGFNFSVDEKTTLCRIFRNYMLPPVPSIDEFKDNFIKSPEFEQIVGKYTRELVEKKVWNCDNPSHLGNIFDQDQDCGTI